MHTIFITGTDTGVGKTVFSAVLAANLAFPQSRQNEFTSSVAVYKPVQTGVEWHEKGDVGEVRRLSGIPAVCTVEGIRLKAPMAPVQAAVRQACDLPRIDKHAERIDELATQYRHVIVEGSGGLLVALDSCGQTIADLAERCERSGVVVVTRSGLGTLNHTELTLEACSRRGIPIAGLVVGSWPDEPTDVDRENEKHLLGLGIPYLGRIPDGLGEVSPREFQRFSVQWFAAAQGELHFSSIRYQETTAGRAR